MLNKYQNILLLVVFLCTGFANRCNAATKDTIRILFVGNSLTYANHLPELIKEIARQDGTAISYTSFLYPDYSLEDHWNEGKVASEIEKGGYDFVVAQQGPSALPESQVLLLDYTKRFSELCNKNKSKLALYMVWPSKARSFDWDNVIISYANAAGKTASLLCPAGLAWKYAWQADSSLPLYSPDNFHPSLTGSVLAALIIYGSLMGKDNFDFVEFSNYMWKNEMTEGRWEVLKQSALKALNK
jgi:hypothetical protein